MNIPVAFPAGEVFFIDAAADYQRDADGALRTTYDGTCHVLDISISAFVTDRGLRALASQAVNLEVPTGDADALARQLRALPAQTPVTFASLTVRTGVSRSGAAYTMWTGRGIARHRSTPTAAPVASLSSAATASTASGPHAS